MSVGVGDDDGTEGGKKGRLGDSGNLSLHYDYTLLIHVYFRAITGIFFEVSEP